MIDEEATFKKYGYYSWEWGRCSIKRIIAVCNECGKVRDVRKTNYCILCSSCARRGERNPMFGKSPSEATKQKMRENCVHLSGPQHPMYGKHITDEHKRILSKANKGKYPSKETRAKRSEALKGRIITEDARRKISETLIGKMSGENNPNWRGGGVKRICLVCSKEFTVGPYEAKEGLGLYCSARCRGIDRSKINKGDKNPNWKGGISFEPYCTKFNDEFKEYIREKFDNVCFLCGKTEVENRQKLSVHHVNYQKSCGCADTEEERKADDNACQFVPLCVSCNSKVNGNRDYWEEAIKNKMKNKLNGWYI